MTLELYVPKGELFLPPEQRPVQGVAAAIISQDGLIYTVREQETNEEYGKIAGMRSLPMERLEPKESYEQALDRLLREEVHLILEIKEKWEIGLYGINIAGVRLWGLGVVLTSVLNPHFRSTEVSDPQWATPEDLRKMWVRCGVEEMINDSMSGEQNVVRMRCKPVRVSSDQIYF